jgi:hypothetical protein
MMAIIDDTDEIGRREERKRGAALRRIIKGARRVEPSQDWQNAHHFSEDDPPATWQDNPKPPYGCVKIEDARAAAGYQEHVANYGKTLAELVEEASRAAILESLQNWTLAGLEDAAIALEQTGMRMDKTPGST